jgi:S1-C subfamily serine protease
MKRVALLAMVLLLWSCEAPQGPLRQVTIERPEALGLSLQELPAQALRPLGLSYGLAVIKAGRLAQSAGLRVGDIVYAVNERRLASIEDFTRIVARIASDGAGGSLGLRVRRGNADFYVPVDLDVQPGAQRPRDTLLRT